MHRYATAFAADVVKALVLVVETATALGFESREWQQRKIDIGKAPCTEDAPIIKPGPE